MKGNIEIEIERRLRAALAPTLLEIENQSHRHGGHNPQAACPGAETHFALRIHAPGLESLSRLEKHRAVMTLVADLMPTPVHALALRFT